MVCADPGDGIAYRPGAIDSEGGAVQSSPQAMGGRIQFVLTGSGNHADDRLPFVQQCDRHAPGRHPVDEGARAIDGIDDPGEARTALDQSILFSKHAILGIGLGDLLPDERLHGPVGDRDDVLRVLLGFDDKRFSA